MKLSRTNATLTLSLVMGAMLVSAEARANGRMPGATELALRSEAPDHLLVRATFGIVQSFDAGKSWQWTCEEAIGAAGVIADPPVAMAPGVLVLLPPTGGALLSRDRGCTFELATGPVAERRGVDLTIDPSAPERVLAIASTLETLTPQGYGEYQNLLIEMRDAGRTQTLLSTLPRDFEAETVEVAKSDPKRVYVSGTASMNPRLGVLYRSDDGGSSWAMSTLELPAGSGSMFISAIHPVDPDRVWVRVPARGDTLGLLPARLYVSDDKGQSFRSVAATKRAMFGFALSPDGEKLAYGGPEDGLFVGPANGMGSFEKVSELGIRCLRWPRQDALYACASEPRDPFSLGVSQDAGKTFQPLYRMSETCPSSCNGDALMQSCGAAWQSVAPRLPATGAMCEADWAQVEGDAGASAAVDAAVEALDAMVVRDAGVTAPRKRSGGTSCAVSGEPAGSRWVPWLALGWLLMGRRKRMRGA